MYSLEEIAALRQKCIALELEGREILDKYSDTELQTICNGIGPDLFPDWMRKIVSDIHPSLQVVAFIHDVEWYESDGEYDSFFWSNRRFVDNGIRVAFATYKWYDPRRYIVCWRANRLARCCHFGGWLAYQHCFNVRKEREAGNNDG